MSASRALDMYDRIYTTEFPEFGTGPVPVESYISPEYFALEREHVFRKSWLLFCHDTEIPEPGDFIVKDIAFLGTSIIVARGIDRKVRAFHNVCRHRGGKLVFESGRDHAKAFVCPMHGWAYGLDGALRGVPEQDRFFGLDKKQCSLPAVTYDTWNGFIFIHAQERPAQTLREHLGSLADAMDGYPFEAMHLVAEYEATLKANWKIVLNIFQESYHVAMVHRSVVPTQVATGPNGAGRLVYFRLHGKHRSATLPRNPDFKPSPTEALAAEFSSGFSKMVDGSSPDELWPGMNPGRIPNFSFDINVVFPINFIDLAQGWYFTYEFWPISVSETRFITKLYFEKPTTWSQRIGQEFTIVQVRDGLMEDLPMLEPNQDALMSGAIKEVLLSDQELAIRHHHHVLDSTIRRAAESGMP